MMTLFTSLVTAMAALVPCQQDGWKDTHRVYLRNGNFMDGRLEQIGEKEILLRWNPTALIRIRIMDLRENGIEEIKIRTLGTPPKRIPVAEDLAGPRSDRESAAPGGKSVDIPPGKMAAIDDIISGMVQASESKKAILLSRLRSFGIEGARYLISQLPKYDAARANAGIFALGNMRDLMIETEIRSLLRSDKPLLRQEACMLLGLREASSSVQSIMPLLQDTEPGVRGAALEAVARAGDASRLSALAEACRDVDQSVRTRAVFFARILAQRTDTEADLARQWLGILVRCADAVKVDLAPAVGRLAGLPKNPEVPSADMIQGIVELLDDRSEAVRAAAALGIGEGRNAGTAASKDLLKALEVERSEGAAMALCDALGELSATEAVDPLIAKLDEASDRVKDAAARALRKITKQPFDMDAEKWREWRQSSK